MRLIVWRRSGKYDGMDLMCACVYMRRIAYWMIPNQGLRFRGFNGSVVGLCKCEVDFSCVSAVPISYDKSCYTQLVTYSVALAVMPTRRVEKSTFKTKALLCHQSHQF
jgi:hypothetical protein